MKRTLKTLCIALIAAGLVFPACKKEEAAQEPTTTAEEVAPEEQPAEEEPVAVEEEPAAEEAAVNEDNYIKAAFEVTCVNAHIDDPARAREIKNEIYPRYGFDEASFAKAQETLTSRETVKMAVETRMERCNKDFAEKLGEAQVAPEGEEAAVVEAVAEAGETKKPVVKKAVPAKTGTLNDRAISGGGFQGAELRLNVRPDFKVSGEFRGKREGSAFIVPVSGTVSDKGDLRATGERGGNTVQVNGKLNAAGASGSLSGSVHKVNYNVTFSAN
ncbi:MAG: hypothetical protein H0U74_11065 [Bradymonadaceae bacterium]|nr:hypothetical protein [Lujinxingiaceae bacterium]